MRMVLTPEQLMKDLLNSESFDDLVAYRLKISLNCILEDLERLYNKDSLTEYQYEDYLDGIKYGRALIVVLEWFTAGEDYDSEKVQLAKYSMNLEKGA